MRITPRSRAWFSGRPALAAALALALAANVTAQSARPPSADARAERAQSPRPQAGLPRTPDGHPDFQGQWYFGSATPLERPRDMADKPVLTPEEARAFEQREAERISKIVAVHPPEWLDYGSKVVDDLRSSLIVDPPDGRVPPLTPEARARAAARRNTPRPDFADDPEGRTIGERCLVFSAGPPVLPGPYNNNLQIVQTRDSMVVLTEMIHDARIVPLDGRPQPPPALKFWLGASRGRWDGDTLVVETTNFADQVTFRGSDEQLRVIERFTLTGPDALRYQFTIDDPTVFTRPWTAMYTMTRSAERMYEYACHEGNVGLLDTLRGARYDEQHPSPAPSPR